MDVMHGRCPGDAHAHSAAVSVAVQGREAVDAEGLAARPVVSSGPITASRGIRSREQ
ncbi:hypothetical protein OG787_12890 [Streptomyces sp. NBC_00075]|uniref:Uncharacterized protein n=1 Tax=Streptomyces sp. NBC_00093 TaxID=2975649 RepID=A0AAU1ZV34_9ACTN